MEGVFIFLGGIFLFFPGLISDGIGFLFLIPFVRRFLIGQSIKGMVSKGRFRYQKQKGEYYEGEWSEGKFISFFDHVHGGTKVVVEKLIPNELIRMKHIGMVDTKNGDIDPIDEAMQKWMGSLEIYEFKESDQNGTLFEVTMVADESFKDVMDVWPQALTLFKRVSEGD